MGSESYMIPIGESASDFIATFLEVTAITFIAGGKLLRKFKTSCVIARSAATVSVTSDLVDSAGAAPAFQVLRHTIESRNGSQQTDQVTTLCYRSTPLSLLRPCERP